MKRVKCGRGEVKVVEYCQTPAANVAYELTVTILAIHSPCYALPLIDPVLAFEMPLQVVPLDLESLPFVASTYIADLPSSPLTRLRYGSCESSALSKHIYQDFHTRIKTSKHDGRTSFTKVIDPDIGEDIAWAQWVIPNDKQLDPPPTPVQPDAQKAIPDTQAPAKPETQGLKGENLAVVADWSAKGRVAWQRSVGRRKHWSKHL